MDFHPHKLVDSFHEQFIEETRNKSLPKPVVILMDVDCVSPICDNNIASEHEIEPLPVHMEYYSEQLSKFEMVYSDGEEENLLPEMQCLPEDLAMALGSVKRSLLESLQKDESEKKLKSIVEPVTKWGLVLSNMPITRNHGNIKIMDKVVAYMKKKNMEIPASFKGKSFANLDYEELANQTTKVDICIGDTTIEQKIYYS